MVYVINLKHVTNQTSFVEVFEDRRNALERMAVWHGCPEKVAVLATDEELENQLREKGVMDLIFEAGFYPKMPSFFEHNHAS